MNVVAQPMSRPSLDLATLWHELWQPWRELHLWPPFSWLTPQPHVCLLQSDGETSRWAGDEPAAGDARTAPFTAVELPEALRLDCRLQLPAMAPADLHDAVALEVRTASPFDPSDLVWGYRARPAADGAVAVHAVLASRRAVEHHLAACAERLAGRTAPEVWARDDEGRAIVVQGYGEAARELRTARGRRLAYALALLALALGTVAAITPTVQLKVQAMQGSLAYERTEREMKPVLAERERLVRMQAQLEALRDVMRDQVEPLAVLDMLTRLIPDDTYLQRLEIQGTKVTISGQTTNTAALMNALSGHPEVRDVRSPSAARRAATGREIFTIELVVSTAPASPASSASAPASAPSPASSAPATDFSGIGSRS